MPATFNDGLVKGRNAGGPITGKTFVKPDTTASDGETVVQSGAGGSDATPANGVSKFAVSSADIVRGKGVSVIMDGRAVLLVGVADLAVGVPVTSDANGKAVAATDGDWLYGTVDEPGIAGGECAVNVDFDGNKYYTG